MSGDALQVRGAELYYGTEADAQKVLAGCRRTEVGVIPKDWAVRTVGDVASVKTGPFGSALHERDYVRDGTPIITVEHLSEYGIVHLNLPQVSEADRKRLRSYSLQKNDIVFSRVGSVDRNSIVTAAEVGWLFSGRLLRVRVLDNSLDPLFMSYQFHSEPCKQRVREVAVGQTMASLNTRILKGIRIAVPPPCEQRAIAEVLSDVDRLLGALETLIAKKRAIKQAVMQQLLTGKTRLPGFRGKWEVKRLGRHVRFLRHGTNSRAELIDDGPVRYLHYGDIHTSANVFLDPQVTPMPRLPTDRALDLDRLEDGDLVLVDASEDVEGVGKSVEITNTGDLEVVSGLHTVSARFDKAVLADGFKAYLQFCPTFQQQLKRLAAGTKVYATNRAHIASVELPLPGIDEQIAIATVLSDMDAEIVALEARRAKTHAIKHGMMHQLLTGRVRMVEPTIGRTSAC